MDPEMKSLAVVFFYTQAKGLVDQMIGNFGLALDTDLVMLAIGWYKRNTWWGRGLLYGAVASIGAKGGFGLGQLFAGKSVAVAGFKSPGAAKLVARYYGV